LNGDAKAQEREGLRGKREESNGFCGEGSE